MKIAGTLVYGDSVEAYKQRPFQRGRLLFLLDGYPADGAVTQKAVDYHSFLQPFCRTCCLTARAAIVRTPR